MASIITATTSSGLTQSADNSGVLQLASGTGNLVTIPSVTGTAMVSGNMPTFSATLASGSVTITGSTWTKMQLNSEGWDTNSCYDNSTNYRFTPNVAGYYQVNISADTGASTGAAQSVVSIYRNGSIYKVGNNVAVGSGSAYGTTVSGLVYCNGTTDYIEAYVYIGATTAKYTTSAGTFFDAAMVRAA
jgi:hypothetical protein